MAFTRDQLQSVTSPHYENYIEENVYELNVVLDKMKKSGHINVGGGTSILLPVNYQELGQAKSIDFDETRTTVYADTVTSGQLEWKYLVCDIAVSFEDRVKNDGKERMVDLAGWKLEEGMNDLKKLMSTFLYQSYSSIGAKDVEGFFSIIRDPTTTTTYADISSADMSSWVSAFYDTTTTTLALYGSNSMDAAYRACWFREPPDICITTKAISSIYASKLQPGERRDPGDGSAGSIDHYFNKCPMVVEAQGIADGTMIWGNTNSLHLFVHPDWNFKVGSWEDDPDRYNALRLLITFVGNLGCTCRQQWGSFTAIAS